ncbi:hypothetical protein ANCCAN_11224 [Ancylostoma caninum]|uniref:Uncharacterized protein n=1 Tax=Ancylostoma caninum TaxID=29170 RepID=A0A368GEJ7_ANCCA|nr:hypothetical protein ANCCAN_11224 [Ancylostoma caninum]
MATILFLTINHGSLFKSSTALGKETTGESLEELTDQEWETDRKDPIQQLVKNILHKICDGKGRTQPEVNVQLKDRSGQERFIYGED